MILSIREWIGIALMLAVLSLAGWLYWKGGHDKGLKVENKALKAEVKDVAESNETSRETQKRVDVQGAETRDRTQEAREAIRDRIQADPRPADRADADILRIATEAYQRAIRASCRVQRTSGCAETTGPAR